MTEHLYDRLRVFHARCLRCMCYVSLKHTREHRITTESLMLRLGVDAIDFYVARRQLGWAGHVCRMDFDRLPRRMLSSWVPHKRPPGAPRMTCPHTQRWCERVHGVSAYSAQPCCARLEVSSAAHHEE